jgi:hypothetical protein
MINKNGPIILMHPQQPINNVNKFKNLKEE